MARYPELCLRASASRDASVFPLPKNSFRQQARPTEPPPGSMRRVLPRNQAPCSEREHKYGNERTTNDATQKSDSPCGWQ